MANAQKTTLIRYRYDALDRLIGHSLSGEPERQRFYCANRLVTEAGDWDRWSIVQHGDHLLAQRTLQSNKVNVAILATDLQRSVLNSFLSDTTRRLTYAAYGHRPLSTYLDSLLGFTGQRLEPLTGHYLLGNGYRAMNTKLMRFNSPDRSSPFRRGGLNAYAYCQGDPINRVDPTGHFFSAITRLFSSISAAYKSYRYGSYPKSRYVSGYFANKKNFFYAQDAYVKEISNVEEIVGGVVKFDDVYDGKLRINFSGHGEPGVMVGDTGIEYSPRGLFNAAKAAGVNFNKYYNARVISCYSADAFNFEAMPIIPFAEELSSLISMPVKGFAGVVLERFDDPRAGNIVNHFHGINKTMGGNGTYQPVTFNSKIRGARS